jgi:hypothetical protein
LVADGLVFFIPGIISGDLGEIDAVVKAALYIGEMAEWSIAAVSKTVVRFTANRGFESPSLRKA